MTPEVEIIHEPDRDRFTITVGGSEAGFAQYREESGEIAFVHTETDPAQQAAMKILGGGWRGHLARRILSVLDDATHEGGG